MLTRLLPPSPSFASYPRLLLNSLFDLSNHFLSLPSAGVKGLHHLLVEAICPSHSLSALPDTLLEVPPRTLSPVPSHTFFKDIERDLRGLAHYVRWVFDITCESAVVTVV